LRLTPRVTPDVNEWWLCDKGRFSVDQHVASTRAKRVIKLGPKGETPASGVDFVPFAKERILSQTPLAILADLSSTNEEFYSLKQIAAKSPQVKVKLILPVSAPSLRFYQALRASGVEIKSPTELDALSTFVVAGENLEEAHPILALRIRRLVKTQGKILYTMAAKTSDLSDVSTANLDETNPKIAVARLQETLEGKNKDFGPFSSLGLLISESWVTHETLESLLEILALAKNLSSKVSISLLLEGSNARGLMDQCDEHVETLSPSTLDSYASVLWLSQQDHLGLRSRLESSGRLVAAVSLHASQAPQAQWLIPGESFLEKRGTYTNLFGKVQVLRKTTRVVAKGDALSEIIFGLRKAFAGDDLTPFDLYEQLVKTKPEYPRSMALIPESSETYHHYERALWR